MGDPTIVETCNSVTKSWVSSIVGLALDKGLISSLDDKVNNYMPPIQLYSALINANQSPIAIKDFIHPFASPHNKKLVGIIYFDKLVIGKENCGANRIGQIDQQRIQGNG